MTTTDNKELAGYTEKLVLAAEEFRLAVAARNAAKRLYDDAESNAKLAGKVYYDARNTLDGLIGA